MADVISTVIDVSALTGFTGIPEGLGRNDLFASDGRFALKIEKIKLEKGEKAPHNTMLVMALTCIDPDNAGKGLIHRVVVTGMNKENVANVIQLGSLMKSAGMSVEQIVSIGAKGQLDLAALMAQLTGRAVYLDVGSEVYENKARSRSRFFVEKAAYEASQKAQDSSWRRTHEYLTATAPTQAAGNGGVNPAAAVAAFTALGAPVGAPPQNGAAAAGANNFFAGM